MTFQSLNRLLNSLLMRIQLPGRQHNPSLGQYFPEKYINILVFNLLFDYHYPTCMRSKLCHCTIVVRIGYVDSIAAVA